MEVFCLPLTRLGWILWMFWELAMWSVNMVAEGYVKQWSDLLMPIRAAIIREPQIRSRFSVSGLGLM